MSATKVTDMPGMVANVVLLVMIAPGAMLKSVGCGELPAAIEQVIVANLPVSNGEMVLL